jgi:ATP-dependent Clp protease adaptor protein ClpS
VHVSGRGIAGVYPFEIAETKADKVGQLAHEAGFPLRAIVEDA